MLQIEYKFIVMAGETRFEHATDGFGDRYSTVEPLPCAHCIIYDKKHFVKFLQRHTGKKSHFFDAVLHRKVLRAACRRRYAYNYTKSGEKSQRSEDE